MSSNEKLDVIRERCDKATPGPWEYDGMHNEIHAPNCEDYFLIISEIRESPHEKIVDKFGHSYNPNLEFIAHARIDIPLLLAEIDRLQAERDAAIEDLRETSDTYRICAACKFLGNNGGCKEATTGQLCANNGSPSKWQWRGLEVQG